jgi:hypothetical protein
MYIGYFFLAVRKCLTEINQGRRIYVASQFQRVQHNVTWPHTLVLNIMVARVCGGRKLLCLMAERKQKVIQGLGTRYNLQRLAPVTFFLQLYSTSKSFHSLPNSTTSY